MLQICFTERKEMTHFNNNFCKTLVLNSDVDKFERLFLLLA